MKTLYLDCMSGISGDMTLAALIDLGAEIDYIVDHLKQLPIDPFRMEVREVVKQGISSKMLVLSFDCAEDQHQFYCNTVAGKHIHEFHKHSHENSNQHPHRDHSYDHHHLDDFHQYHNSNHGHSKGEDNGNTHHGHIHRKASDILKMISISNLPDRVKQRSIAVFEVIASAEGKIHGMDHSEVHFHEVGAMDSIIDIIGVCLALESLGIERIIASPVPIGSGKIRIAHGLYPIPAPATAEILTGIPLSAFDANGELTTPTGAGFLKALADEFGPIPGMIMEKIGYGAGKKDFEHPNVLRVILLKDKERIAREKVTVLECQVDDMTPENLGYLMEQLFQEGALDVYFTPVQMKKNRPGTLITVITEPHNAVRLEEMLFKETSSFGVRSSVWSRRLLSRRFETVRTPYGLINVKIGLEGEEVYQISPEYEDARKAARENQVPLTEVFYHAHKEAREQLSLKKP